MSKYIKLEDAINICREKPIIENGATTGVGYPTPAQNITALSDLPTIEVNEDCISREYILGEAFASDEYNRETKSFDLPVVSVRDIEDAPSVVPKVPNEDCIGDCNACRFAGCSECDDCINGSQWVRMTREDEE